MTVELRWQLHNTQLVEAGPGFVGFITPSGRFRLPLSPAVQAAVAQLESQSTRDEAGIEGIEAVWRLLDERGVLARALAADGRVIARVLPARPDQPRPSYDPAQRCRLSRFACLRRVDDTFVLEAPTARGQAVISPAALALLATLDAPDTGDTTTALFRRLLGEAGLLTEALASGDTAEDANPALRGWSFHDLTFHAGIREPRAPLPPAPALRPPFGGPLVALPQPDTDSASRPLASVMDARRSARQYADTSLTPADLGALLYRAARVTGMRDDSAYEATRRPYPSAGALYPLELYAIPNACAGLDFGLYHYRPEAHGLERLAADEDALRVFATLCAAATGEDDAQPQITLAITARVARVAWRYPQAALALILEDVGVLMQTLYLVAADLGLASCALGAAAPALFARASGIDRYAEPQVAGFLAGVPENLNS